MSGACFQSAHARPPPPPPRVVPNLPPPTSTHTRALQTFRPKPAASPARRRRRAPPPPPTRRRRPPPPNTSGPLLSGWLVLSDPAGWLVMGNAPGCAARRRACVGAARSLAPAQTPPPPSPARTPRSLATLLKKERMPLPVRLRSRPCVRARSRLRAHDCTQGVPYDGVMYTSAAVFENVKRAHEAYGSSTLFVLDGKHKVSLPIHVCCLEEGCLCV